VTRLVLALAVAALAVGCSGADEEEAVGAAGTGVTQREPPRLDGGTPADQPGDVLLAFVRAAGRGDADAMWRLLSGPTQASIGPTLEKFRGSAAREFQERIGVLAPTARVIFSRSLTDRWAVAAVAGEIQEESDSEPEYETYGAALVREGGGLTLELGGVVISGHDPVPEAELDDALPKLAANVGAGGDLTDVRMWLDERPFPAERGENDTPFTATLRGRPAQPLRAGLHEVVVFAATTDTATATAWAFTVTDGS
jgi:hypothetical protein